MNAATPTFQPLPQAASPLPLFVQQYQGSSELICAELIKGLQAPEALLSPKFLYDRLGSKLFEAITELPEYYLTRTENWIFRTYLQDIAKHIGSGCTLIDLGAGNCEKAAHLFECLRPKQYVAIDISVEYLRTTLARLHHQWPTIPMLGFGADFSSKLELASTVFSSKRVFFYPGSSIGNFSVEQAGLMLQQLAAQAGKDGWLLIGMDLLKSSAALQAAYDDPLQVTAAFNRNILLNVNRLLGADFVLSHFKHLAVFNRQFSRVEMYLQALQETRVRWGALGGGTRCFRQGECIHTENSYKYSFKGAEELLNNNGFCVSRYWFDPHKLFCVFLAKAREN